jgi:hypothetical protein
MTAEHRLARAVQTLQADVHSSPASSRMNQRPRRFKWTRPFHQKTKSGFCTCAIIVQTQSNTVRCTEINYDFKLRLQQVTENFHSLQEGILKITQSSDSVKRSRKELEDEEQSSTYKTMFTEMIDVSVTNISHRFCNASKLKFSHPPDPKQFTYHQQQFHPEHAFEKVCVIQIAFTYSSIIL